MTKQTSVFFLEKWGETQLFPTASLFLVLWVPEAFSVSYIFTARFSRQRVLALGGLFRSMMALTSRIERELKFFNFVPSAFSAFKMAGRAKKPLGRFVQSTI